MTTLENAVKLDIDQQIEAASEAYELILTTVNPELKAYINLACLYWEVTDYGFNSGHHLPLTFVQKAGERMYVVLDMAKQEFGNDPEVEFWRLYFNFITLGDEPFPEIALKLTEKKEGFLVPYFHIYDQTKDPKYLPQVKELLAISRQELTTKNRYILSILEANNVDNS
jgi:hypothetical protein